MKLDDIMLSEFSDLLDFGILLTDFKLNLLSANNYIKNHFDGFSFNENESLIPFLKNFIILDKTALPADSLLDASNYALGDDMILKNLPFSDAKRRNFYNICLRSAGGANNRNLIILFCPTENILPPEEKPADKLPEGLEDAPECAFIFDKTGNITDCNAAAAKTFGRPKAELVGADFSQYLSEGGRFSEYLKILSRSCAGGEQFDYICGSKKAALEFDGVKLSENGYLCVARHSRGRAKDKPYFDYFLDEMTGLFSRHYIINKFEEYKKNPSLYPVSVILGDINGLKMVNDAFGRKAGDKLIRKTARILAGACEENDIAGKWEGDEFIIISANSSEEKVTRIISAIKKQCDKNFKNNLNISISFGYAIKNCKKECFDDILCAAENMMLKNKIYEGASFRSQAINLILNTLHEKNKREEQHSVRVSRICVEIGKAINLPENEVNKLKVIGLLHDIGKIGVSEAILNKMGKLTASEFEEIKKHSEIGYRILSSSPHTSEIAQDVLDHHERYDGRGYPRGKPGNKLSLMTRILTIADSYDAMTSERPYKSPMSKSEAIEELLLHSAKQFDPELVEVFINNVLNNSEIML